MEKHSSTKLRLYLVLLFFGLFLLAPQKAIASSSYDLSNHSNWNIRIDGDSSGSTLSSYSITSADVDNDGKNDIIVGAIPKDTLYIIYGSLLENILQNTKIIDLNVPTNYSIKLVGPSGSNFSINSKVADINNDSKNDLLIGASDTDFNSHTNSGSVYIVYNELINGYSGTGNTVDMTDSANYNIRFDGSAGSYLGFSSSTISDLDKNGKNDIIITSPLSSYTAPSSGSIYVIYDSIIDNYSNTGNNVDLGNNLFYNLRFDGSGFFESLGYFDVISVKDIDSDGAQDLIIGGPNNNDLGGVVYIIKHSIISTFGGVGNNINLNNTDNYNIRLIGGNYTKFGDGVSVDDFNGDNKLDLLIGDRSTGENNNLSGGVYVIFNNVFDYYSGTGNSINVSDTSNYNIKFIGNPQDQLPKGVVQSVDINNDGISDILFGDDYTDYNSRADSGSLFVIYNSVLSNYSGTGNNLDIANSSSYSMRYDGEFSSGKLSYVALATNDINNDGSQDILIGERNANNNSRSASGSLYIIYNFPHSISLNSISSLTKENYFIATGTVIATKSVTNIKGVQYSLDNSNFSGTWNDCSATDGTFDSTSENFNCNVSTTGLTDGSHTIRFRAYDDNISYTAISNYASASFTYDHTSPLIDWTDTTGNKKKYESTGNDNVFTLETLPTFIFTKSSDATAGLSKYQILVNDNVYIDNIDPVKPGDKDYREDDDKYIKYDGDNNILVHAKKDKDRLITGKAYKWKVRAVDSAGNSTDTTEKILRINTHEANFSHTWFPLTLLNIGGTDINFSSIAPDKIPSSLNISVTTPTFYGIAPVGSKVTLRIEKENDSNTGRDLVLNTTSSTNESSRFGINLTDKLNTKTEYFINLSAVNPQGDYVELPEFKLNVGGSGGTGILRNIEKIFKPKNVVPTSTKGVNHIVPPKAGDNVVKKHCFLWLCW